MKQKIDYYNFRDAFQELRPNNFTDDGLRALFDYLEELENDTGGEFELDVIALCCDYTEYSDLKEFQANYGNEYETFEDIEYRTMLIPVTTEMDSKGCNIKSFIIQDF